MTEATSGASAQGYRVLARKYRPQTFADLIGQEAMVRTLTNAFAIGPHRPGLYADRRARRRQDHHRPPDRPRPELSGDAPSIEMPELTPQCEAILEIAPHGRDRDGRGLQHRRRQHARDHRQRALCARSSARYKIYIIDEVHMLSKSAFNALLKTLEEPPPHVKFIFATTEIRKVPVTILSRCQRFDLKRLDAALLVQHYARIAALENVDDRAPKRSRMIARAAEGSVRDGLSLLDQAIAYGEGKVKAADVAGHAGPHRPLAHHRSVRGGHDRRYGHAPFARFEAQHETAAIRRRSSVDLADFVHWVTRLKVVKDSALADPSRTEAEKQRGAELRGAPRHGASDARLADAAQGHQGG